MTRHWGTLLLLSLTLSVAGCVRTAGTPYEPVAVGDGTTATDDVQPTATALPVTDDPADAATPIEADAQGENTTPTDVPITVISPTETLLPSLQVTETPTEAPPTPTDVPATVTEPPTDNPTEDVQPTATEAFAEPTTDNTAAETADVTPTQGSQPGGPSGPSGPVPIQPNTPIPSPTSADPATDLQPTPTAFGDTDDDTETTDAETAGDEGCTYIVRAGDNAFRIAVNNNITLNQLREANPGQLTATDPIIQPGDVLDIPGCGQGTITRTPQPTATSVQDTVEGDETPVAEDEGPTPPEGYIVYEVLSGDTLIAIARRYGTTVNDLVEINDLLNPDVLDTGDELFVPDPNAAD